ncbi:MAG: GNAT family N-acetyltransferase [Planctomycetes bacterium]|nr:GNAT family N-acetyltransferase [Planctomycetota bacterium]
MEPPDSTATTTIRTERLVLRRARASDLQEIHAVLSDPTAMRYWSTPPHRTLSETEHWLTKMLACDGDDFVVTFEGRVLGKAGLFRDPEVGFILHSSFTRRGFGVEAVRAVVARAFDVRGLALARADVDPRNTASLKLLARVGFVEVGRKRGTWQVGDELCDSVYLELTPEHFRAAHG